jgi:hypothetical protein
VKGNTVENNTRSCRGAKFERAFSGGVVVAVSPYFDGTAKPRNNSIIGNHFGRNKPDIFYDKSGSGNRFIGNLCNTSVPSRLCN